MKLQGNTILITGGSGGIGFELASQLLRRGNTVIVTGRDQGALDAARRRLPGLRTLQSDVRDPHAIAALHERVMKDFPAMNVLINNAGIMRKVNLQTFGADLQGITEEIEINLSGSIRMVMQFLPHLKAQARAAIVNVSSGLAFNPYPIAPIYGATKAGIHSFTQSLRVQLKQTNVRVFELAPPAVDTPLNHTFADELRGTPLMSVAKLVDETLKGLERDRPEIRVGFANVSKLMSRIAPGFILKQLSKPVDQMLAQMKQLSS
ncbi:SDR family oxidoreductase [Sorangium sp. So ce204]|uniref:SDR family oxidoreductase n=1 Tax=Sorangium sp. So ce204 TaxID=3133288 RepID=UPI003F601E7C